MADEKISQLAENTTPISSDELALVDDPAGAAVTERLRLTNLLKFLTGQAQMTAPLGTDILPIIDDPSGAPAVQHIEVGDLLGEFGVNLAKNSPGQIVTDGAEPQWWDDVANATITDEDTAGEAPPDKFERCFKVVTIANNVYGYQTLTFADEPLLDAGVTVISFSCWVYCATGSKASIGIYGTNLGLQESSQAGAGAWTLLKVEAQALNGADAAIELRLIVDTDTAWFACPMLNLGSKTIPWVSRLIRFQPLGDVLQYDHNTTGDIAWTNADCTAKTHPLAVGISCRAGVFEADGTVGSIHGVGHSSTLTGADFEVVMAIVHVIGQYFYGNDNMVMCDDGQNIRYHVNEIDADGDVRAFLQLTGYWRWA